jgi:hypothetical protein
MTMKYPLLAITLLGVGSGLTAGLIYRQRYAGRNGDEEPYVNASAESMDDEANENEVVAVAQVSGRERKLALLPNPAPTTARLMVAAGSGVLAAWGAARGGLIGHGASLLGATMLGRVARN